MISKFNPVLVFRIWKGIMFMMTSTGMQQIHEWATANGLKAETGKEPSHTDTSMQGWYSATYLVDIGDNVVKVVPKVKNLGFILN
jgi:hypothetical protein